MFREAELEQRKHGSGKKESLVPAQAALVSSLSKTHVAGF
jgi:hypothetical protein